MSSLMSRTLRAPAALLTSALVLSACGGGSDDTQQVTPERAAPQDVAMAAATNYVDVPGAVVSGTGWRAVNKPSANFFSRARLPVDAGANPVYVDALNGNDNYDGTTPQKAWKSLSKVTRQSLIGKTAVLLSCTSTWTEPLVIEGPANYNVQPAPSDAINGLVIAAYGCSSDIKLPVISGLAPLGVSAVSGGAYWTYSIVSSQKPLRIKKVGADNLKTPMVVASYPDQRYGSYAPVYQRIGGPSINAADRRAKLVLDQATASDSDKVANSASRIVGATIHVKTRPWVVESREITAYNATTREVTLSSPLDFDVQNDWPGYILEGLPWMLNQANEWVYVSTSGSTGEIRVLKDAGLAAPTLLTGKRDAGIHLKWVKNVTVQRIWLEDHPVDAIAAYESPNLTVKDVAIFRAGKRGVSITGVNFNAVQPTAYRPELATISDSYFHSSATGGIEVRSVPGTQIMRNQFYGQGGYGLLRVAQGVIYLSGDSGPSINPVRQPQIADNHIQNAPGTGIRTKTTSDVEVTGNTVVSFCEQFADCGGIYVGGPGPWMDQQTSSALPARPVETVGRGGLISNNIVVGGTSNFNGYFHTGVLKNQAIGIYLDETSNKVQVQQNTVSGTEIGIYLHDAFSNTIANNTVRGTSHASIALKARRSDKVLENNEIRDNVLFSHRSVTIPDLPASPTNSNQEIIGLKEDKTVYAMKWESESINIADLFTGPRAHRVSGNQILTVRNGAQPVWRRQHTNVMADGGGAWWFARNYAAGPGANLGYADWLQLSGQTGAGADVVNATLAYRQYSLNVEPSLIVGGQPLDAAAWDFNAHWEVPIADRGTFVMRTSPVCHPACGELKAGHQYDYVRSKAPFAVNHVPGDNLYVVRYQARSVNASEPASIRLRADYSDAAGGLNTPGTLLPAGDFTQFEQFFRVLAPTGAVTGPDMKLYVRATGNNDNLLLQRTAQFRELSLQKVNSITYRPDMSGISLNVVNLSRTDAKTIDVSQLGVDDGSTWVNDAGQVITSMTLGPRQSAQIFRKDGGWLIAP